jgi:hypothetical protein
LEIVNYIPLQPPQKKGSSESGDESEKKERKSCKNVIAIDAKVEEMHSPAK